MLAAFFASVFWLYDVADTNGLRHRPSLIFAVLTATPVFMVITKRFGIYSN